MAKVQDPTVQRRRLRIELRKARDTAGLKQAEVARAMDWSPSKLIRIESGQVSISTNDLKALLKTTDGNLSVHARKLEDAGYVSCEKTFSDRTPRTTYTLTASGRRALEKYLDHMDAIIRAARHR